MGPPRRRTTLEGLGAHPATGVLPCARHRTGTGGMGNQSAVKQTTRLCVSEAAHYIEGMQEKSSIVKTSQLGKPVKTHKFDHDFEKKKLCRSVQYGFKKKLYKTLVEEDIRAVGRGGRKVRPCFLCSAQQIR